MSNILSTRPDRATRSGVALEVVVDVDRDTRVRGTVRARKGNLRRVRAAATGDLDLCAANVLMPITQVNSAGL